MRGEGGGVRGLVGSIWWKMQLLIARGGNDLTSWWYMGRVVEMLWREVGEEVDMEQDEAFSSLYN